MIIIGYILFVFLLVHFGVILYNYLSKPFLPTPNDNIPYPKISILIPARNEEKNLPDILNDLSNLHYNNYEVIVCNDHSTDGTLNVLEKAITHFPHLKFFTNKPLPYLWMGKNFACHQLSKNATGEWFLYLDADVRVKPDLLRKVITYVNNKEDIEFLSIFPEQIIQTADEWKTIPLMNWILLTFLPLPLVEKYEYPSLSAANGQMMFFNAQNYRENNWHRVVKNNNVEDIAIARRMKEAGCKTAVLLGDNDILCRMYPNYKSALQGFSLNVHQFFTGSRVWMVLFLIITWLRLPFFLISSQYLLFVFSLLIVFLIKFLLSSLSRMSFLKNMMYHFEQLWAFTLMVFYNLKNYQRKRIEWKGRIYKF